MDRKTKFWICWFFEKTILVFVAGFFIWSGWRKLEDLSAFTRSVGNFELVELGWEVTWNGETRNFFAEPMDAVIAYTVPWFEIVAAAALLVPLTRMAGAMILTGLLISFNLALRHARDLGITDLKCGCHGVSGETTNYTLKMASNYGLIALLALVVALIWAQRRLASERETPNLSP